MSPIDKKNISSLYKQCSHDYQSLIKQLSSDDIAIILEADDSSKALTITLQQKKQETGLQNNDIVKIDRLPGNAKLHLLHKNTLLNNIQLALSDPQDYIDMNMHNFAGLGTDQQWFLEDEIRRAIHNYVIIDPKRAKNLLQKLGLSGSYQDIQKCKKLLSEAIVHTYSDQTRKKTTPRICYVDGYPLLFGKNMHHVPCDMTPTKAEQKQYDVDTSLKIFATMYGLVRAHDHIKISEEESITSLTELNSLFVSIQDAMKHHAMREEYIHQVQEIINIIDGKLDAQVVKAKIQDLDYIIEHQHIGRNKAKIQAAWNKIKKRIAGQHTIKYVVDIQKQSLHEHLVTQEHNAHKYITKLLNHIQSDQKNRSPRSIALEAQKYLFAKPFSDIANRTIYLDDQARQKNWMPYTQKKRLEIDLLLQQWYITILQIDHTNKTKNYRPKRVVESSNHLFQGSLCDQEEQNIYFAPCQHIMQQLEQEELSDKQRKQLMQQACTHINNCQKKLSQ